MPRLLKSLSSSAGDVSVELEFGVDPGRIPSLRGTLHAVLELTCQRCMDRMQLPIEASFALGLVADEAQAAELPEDYDPLVVGDEPMVLSDVVEDELILALPIVVMHSEESCTVKGLSTGQEAEQEVEQRPANPFAVLAELKTKH